jgi:hypothetical protein
VLKALIQSLAVLFDGNSVRLLQTFQAASVHDFDSFLRNVVPLEQIAILVEPGHVDLVLADQDYFQAIDKSKVRLVFFILVRRLRGRQME